MPRPATVPVSGVWTPTGEDEDDDVHPWTVPTLRRAYQESGDNMRRALEYLADRAGQEVTSRQLGEDLELENGAASVAGMIGAFARRCWNRYDRYLPWNSWWQPIDDPDVESQTETVFVMPEEVGQVIQDLRSGKPSASDVQT